VEQTNRFVKIGADGAVLDAAATEWEAVLDNRTGLMWALEPKKVKNYKGLEAAIKKVKAGGFDDWRLPTVEELFLLADRTRISPAIDTDFFPDTPSDWFWSSTPYANSPGYCAWDVYFYGGYANWSGHGGSGFVRAVRVGQ
jgi:hypothetical protein